MLTINRLKEVLRYDAETGLFTWIVRTSNRVKIGSVAGTLVCGYLSIHIDGERFQAHRLAWFYMKGNWPYAQLDHRNGVRSDNRWNNLREAPGSLNHENLRRARADNSTSVLGVRKMRGKFQANWLHALRRA